MESLRADLVGEVDAYITGTLQRWVIYEVSTNLLIKDNCRPRYLLFIRRLQHNYIRKTAACMYHFC